jgi:ABC-type methionine transport system ATPase subunit
MNVKYLLFVNLSSEYYLYPVESFLGFEDYGTTSVFAYFRTNDNPESSATRITMTCESGKGIDVVKAIANAMATAKTSVLIVADDVNGSYIDPKINSISAVTDVTQSSISATSISTTDLSVSNLAGINTLSVTGATTSNTLAASTTITAGSGIGIYGASAPASQPTAAGDVTISAAGDTNAVYRNTTFTGGTGTTAYTFGDVVAALKALGIIEA